MSIAKSFTYDPVGNLLSKSDVGNYLYPAAGQPFPHAVSSISGGVINTTFSYDANGNMLSGNGLAITYTAFNKPESITRGAANVVFTHDSEHKRCKQKVGLLRRAPCLQSESLQPICWFYSQP